MTISTGNLVSSELLMARDVIAARDGVVHALLRVIPTPAPEAARRPVTLALVIDRSGSMGDVAFRGEPGGGPVPTKLAFVRRAARRLVEAMSDGDAVAVVSFDDTVRVELPRTVLGPAARPRVARAISRIGPGGMTNLWGGLEAGMALVQGEPEGRSSKVLVLTDGMANQGAHTDLPAFLDRCATAATAGTTVSTLGVGVDYLSLFLARMADSGNGDFHHVEDPDALEEAFAEELSASSWPALRGTSVRLDVPAGIAVEANLNGYPQERSGDTVTVHLGDVARPKDLLLEVRTQGHAPEVLPLSFTVSGTSADDGSTVTCTHTATLAVVDAADVESAPVRDEVVQRIVELLDAWSHMAALGAFEAGDTAAAATAITTVKTRITVVGSAYGDVADRAGLPAMSASVDALERSLQDGAMSMPDLKQTFNQARRNMRGQPRRGGGPSQR